MSCQAAASVLEVGVAGFSATVLLTTLFLAVFFSTAFRSALEAEFSEKSRIIGQRFAASIVEDLLIEDDRLMATKVTRELRNEDLVFIAIYDAEGLPVHRQSSIVVSVGQEHSTAVVSRMVQTADGQPVLEVLAPVIDIVHGQVGTARLLFSLQRLDAGISRSLREILWASLAILLLFGGLGAYVLGARLSRPLTDLVGLVRTIGVGNYSQRIKPKGGHETQTLALAINGMCEQIQQDMRKLARSEENTATLVDSIGDAIIATDAEMRVTRMNLAATRLIGLSQAQCLTRPFSELCQLTDPETDELLSIPSPGTARANDWLSKPRQGLLHARDGTMRRIAATVAPMRAVAGEALVGNVLILRDVTREHALQEQLQHSQKMDAVGQLAGGIAHDFNNMLSGIIGGAELLEDQVSTGDGRDVLKVVLDAAERARDLTRNLLAFSRKGKMQEVPVDLHALVLETIDLLKRSIDKKVRVTRSLKAQSHILVGDASQVQSALLNLGINAAQAMPKGGTLHFETQTRHLTALACHESAFALAPGHFIELTVSDTGKGIPKAVLPRIFEPFFTSKPQGKGTGLGLAAVYGVVCQHHGAIDVTSQEDVGTTFKLLLPLAGAPVDERPKSLAPVQGSGCVLVVDDEPLVRQMATRLLEKLGYETLAAEGGRAALEIFSSNAGRIDAVLLDRMMPEMNGQETLAELQRLDPDVRVVFTSGYAAAPPESSRSAVRAIPFVAKPFTRTELSRAIALAIEGEDDPEDLS